MTNKTPVSTQWDRAGYYAKRTAVAALFTSTADGEKAVMALKAKGIPADQIGIAMRDRDAQGAIIEETGTHATKGAVQGACGGVLGGAIAGFLVGIGALAIPGIGPVVSGRYLDERARHRRRDGGGRRGSRRHRRWCRGSAGWPRYPA